MCRLSWISFRTTSFFSPSPSLPARCCCGRWCGAAPAAPGSAPAQATHLINREDALVVDVREPGEYGAGHVLGAKNLPLARIESGAGDVAKKKDATLILYCDSGDRSGKAAAALRSRATRKVVNLSGGFGAWKQAGLPVEK